MVAAGEDSTGHYVGARIANRMDAALGVSDTTHTLAGDKFKVVNLGGSYTLGPLSRWA